MEKLLIYVKLQYTLHLTGRALASFEVTLSFQWEAQTRASLLIAYVLFLTVPKLFALNCRQQLPTSKI